MAQQYLDFEDATVVGDALAYESWSPSSSGTLVLESSPAAVGWSSAFSTRQFAKLVNALNSNVIEVYYEGIPDGEQLDFYVGGATGYSAYKCDIQQETSNLRLSKFVNGSSTFGFASASKVIPSTTLHSVRFSWNGDTGALKLRVWQTANSEPGTWDIETTDASITASGTVGLFTYSVEYTVRAVGIGTDGDAAPTSAAAAIGPNTPINLSTTNILATSARLNWEQG